MIRRLRIFFCVLRYVLRKRREIRYDNEQITRWYQDNDRGV